MEKILLSFFLFLAVDGYAQCSFDIPLTIQPNNCIGSVLTVDSISGVSYNKITWYNGTAIVNMAGVTGSEYGITVAGGNGRGSASNQLYHTLSDSTIGNPIAKPIRNTDYILDVISREGCTAIQKIPVFIATPIKIPNAFTPNGDGDNDVFNILGGTGSQIDQFSIYDRWGQLVFEEKNKMPGNNGGWDGNLNGKPAPPGSYVYFIKVTSLEGTKQAYRGTVLLIR